MQAKGTYFILSAIGGMRKLGSGQVLSPTHGAQLKTSKINGTV